MSRSLKKLLIAAAAIVGIVMLIRITLDPVATWAIRRQLKQTPGMDGIIAGAHVSIFPPHLEIDRLKIIETPGGDWDKPLYYAARTELSLLWRCCFIEKLGRRLTTTLGDHAPLKVARLATAMIRGRLQKAPLREAFVTLDAWNPGLNFSGRASVTGNGWRRHQWVAC